MNEIRLKLLIAALIIFAFAQIAAAQTTVFTYQGRLSDGSAAANGTYDLGFALFDAPTGGTQIGEGKIIGNVNVSNGVFTVQLDFGAQAFGGANRYLEISIKRLTEANFTTLAPRQPLTSTPYAIRATNAEQLGGTEASQFLLKNGSGSQLTNINGANIAAGTITGSQLSSDARSKFDTDLVALLRWDLLPNYKTISAGSSPNALAFDGTFVYVANYGGNTVTRIRAATGAIEGAPIAVGVGPRALAFDGTFVYVANYDSNNITRIRAATGAVEGAPIAVAAGSNPRALAFDGTFIYVARYSAYTVTRIRAATGAVEGAPIAVGSLPRAVVFDGVNIYVANSGSNNVTRFVP